MDEMTSEYAIRAGGWDPRYAVVRAIRSMQGVAAVLVDPNGDGGSIDLDEYRRGPDGDWIAGNSGGGPGDSGTSWSPHMATTYGRSAPWAQIVIDYCGETYAVTAEEDGWWLFATPSLDDHTMPAGRSTS